VSRQTKRRSRRRKDYQRGTIKNRGVTREGRGGGFRNVIGEKKDIIPRKNNTKDTINTKVKKKGKKKGVRKNKG